MIEGNSPRYVSGAGTQLAQEGLAQQLPQLKAAQLQAVQPTLTGGIDRLREAFFALQETRSNLRDILAGLSPESENGQSGHAKVNPPSGIVAEIHDLADGYDEVRTDIVHLVGRISNALGCSYKSNAAPVYNIGGTP